MIINFWWWFSSTSAPCQEHDIKRAENTALLIVMMYDDAPLLRLRLQEIRCLIPSRILCAAVFEGPTLDPYI